MTGPCFVDANVFVYVRDPRAAEKQRRAIAWRDHLWQSQLGRTSVQVLSETYSTLKRLGGAGPDELWDSVARYFAWSPHPVNEVLMRRAREIEQRHRISWWDAMVVAAAQLQGCSVLLTEDLQDGGVYGSVTVRSPFTLEVREPVAGYDAGTRLASPHRRRGRPRRMASLQS
jgi:predicted nucleic acid-binding protein